MVAVAVVVVVVLDMAYSDKIDDRIDCNVAEFKSLLDELKGSTTTTTATTTDDKLIILLFTQAGCNTCSLFLAKLNDALQKREREGVEKGEGRKREKRKRNVIVLDIKERERREEGEGGEGEEEEEECTLIHDMMHISSTPSVYIYNRNGLEEVDLDNAKTVDEAVSLVLAKLD